MKKTLALLLALIMTLMAAGCGEQGFFEKSPEGADAVRVGITAEPMTLDPGRYTTTGEATLISHLFEGLTAEDAESGIVGAVAESWEITATKDAAKRPVYTFTLREDACWSDGTPVKAEDFIYAWTRIISGEAESPYAYLFHVILGASEYSEETAEELGLEAPDDTTLVVTLEGDCAYFPALLALPAFAPVREDVVSENPEGWYNDPTTLIGNGAYTVTEWTHDDHVTMAKNAAYRAADSVLCENLEFVIRSGAALEGAARDGSIQAAIADLGGINRVKGADGSVSCFAFNMKTVTDPLVRQALSVALDRESILNAAGYLGEAVGTEKVYSRLDIAGRLTPGEALIPFDGASAQALLGEAEEVPEKLTLLTNYITSAENDSNVIMANAMAEQWQETLGITVEVKALPYDEFTAARDAGEFDVVRCGMAADFDDPAAYLELFISGAAGNYGGYASSEYNTLLTDSRREQDPEERAKQLEEAENLLIAEDAAVIPMRRGTTTLSLTPWLQGVTCNGLGLWNFAGAVYEKPAEETAA